MGFQADFLIITLAEARVLKSMLRGVAMRNRGAPRLGWCSLLIFLLAGLLPAGAKVTLQQVENLKNSEEEIRAEFGISIPGFANVAGGRLLLPVHPFQGAQRYPFRHARRAHPVYFPYPYREIEDIVMALPPGVTVESVPQARQHKRLFAECALTCAAGEGGKLHVQRDFTIKKSLVPVEQYPVLKSFFDQVRETDEGQIVLALPAKK